MLLMTGIDVGPAMSMFVCTVPVVEIKNGHRIDGRTVSVHLEMKVGACRTPRGSHCGDHIASIDPLPLLDFQFVTVCIQAGGPIAMVQYNNISVSTSFSGGNHSTGPNGLNGGSLRGRKIYAFVVLDSSMEWI